MFGVQHFDPSSLKIVIVKNLLTLLYVIDAWHIIRKSRVFFALGQRNHFVSLFR